MKNDTLDKGTSLHAEIYRALRRERKWMDTGRIGQDISWPCGKMADWTYMRDSIQRRISDIRNGRYGPCLPIEKKMENGWAFYRIAKNAK